MGSQGEINMGQKMAAQMHHEVSAHIGELAALSTDLIDLHATLVQGTLFEAHRRSPSGPLRQSVLEPRLPEDSDNSPTIYMRIEADSCRLPFSSATQPEYAQVLVSGTSNDDTKNMHVAFNTAGRVETNLFGDTQALHPLDEAFEAAYVSPADCLQDHAGVLALRMTAARVGANTIALLLHNNARGTKARKKLCDAVEGGTEIMKLCVELASSDRSVTLLDKDAYRLDRLMEHPLLVPPRKDASISLLQSGGNGSGASKNSRT